MKKFNFAVVAVIAIVLSACGVNPKYDPSLGYAEASATVSPTNTLAGLPKCSTAVENENLNLVDVCRNGAGSLQDCYNALDAFVVRYPSIRCRSSHPNMLAPGYPYEISTEYVLQYRASLSTNSWM